MDDDNEDYLALFFTECGELLADLQEQLDRLMDGERDPELVNAAFRAVHSVKGGAAAFGFDHLIGFAHVFETVMDGLRSGRLQLGSDIVNLLMRSGDVMETLIEQARDGGDVDSGHVDRVRQELEEQIGRSSAEEAPEDGPSAPASAAPPPPAPAEAEPEPGEPREVIVSLIPSEDFIHGGHDPLRVIRAARELDLVAAEPIGDLPPLAELTPEGCPIGWKLRFETDRPPSAFTDFFSVYEHIAVVEIVDENWSEAPAAPAGAEAAPASIAPTESKGVPAPSAAAAPPEAGGKDAGKDAGKDGARHSAAKTLRVELPRIDRLVNLVGEIVITQAVLAQKLSETDAATALEVGHSVEAMSRQTRELQESVMAIRAQPVKSVFSRMPRVVRDLADKLGKEARLVLAGEHTEVDTTVIEELAEPLTHMLRNSMDHGLELPEERAAAGKPRTGTIRLAAEHRGERVIIIIEDDGRGINRERVVEKAIENGLIGPDDNLTPEDIDQLIFHPGFSTAKEISSVSGRGVGMDVVKKKIQALGGRCHLRSDPGKGTRFQITLPLTLAVLDGMTICVGDERFILPLSSVVEALRIDGERVEVLPDRSQVLARRGQYLRLISLRNALGIDLGDKREEMAIVVDTETNGHVALLVDELIGQRQVVLKSLEANFKRVEGVSGATILGDGRVALILDIPSLVSMGGSARAPIQEVFH